MKTFYIKTLTFCYMLLVSGIITNLNAQEYTIEIYATFNRGSNSSTAKCSNFCKVTAVYGNGKETQLWEYGLGSLPENTTWATNRVNFFQYSNKIVKLKIETRRTWANLFGANCVESSAYEGYCEIPISFSGGTYEKTCYSSNYKDSKNRDLYAGYTGSFTIKIYPTNITLKYESNLGETNILPDKHRIKIKAKENYPSGSFTWEYQTGSIQKVEDKWVPDYKRDPNVPVNYSGGIDHCMPYDHTEDNCAYCLTVCPQYFDNGNCAGFGGFWLYKNVFVNDAAWKTITGSSGKSEISICGNDLMSNFVEIVVKTRKQVRIRINYTYKQSEIIVLDGKKSSPTITEYTVTPNLCNGDKSASIKLKFSEALLANESLSIGINGTFNESYANITSLDSDNSYTIKNLAAGQYTFSLLGKYPYSSNSSLNTYTTYTGSDAHKRTGTIQDPAKLTFSGGTSSNVSCNGGKDGKIPVNIGGGTSPYSIYYLRSNENAEIKKDITGAGAYTLTGLTAGEYTVRLVDKNNCKPKDDAQKEITINKKAITQPAAAVKFSSVSYATPTGYGLINGQISVSAKGGTGSYTYEWKKNGTSFTPSSTNNPKNLGKGTYFITVKDSKYNNASSGGESNCRGCYDTITVVLTQPDQLEVKIIENKKIKCKGDANGSLKITVKGGVSPYTKYKLTSNGSVGTEKTFPTNSDNIIIDNLTAGEYKVTVIDSKQNSTTSPFTLTEPAALNVSDISVTMPKCNGDANGSVKVTVSGGTSPYTYAWKRNNIATGTNSANISGLAAGNISVRVTDKNGCYADKSTTMGQPSLLTAKSSIVLPSAYNKSDGKITITPTGGTPPHSYKWDDNSTVNPRQNISARDNPYTVTVTDANGCKMEINDISVINPLDVSISVAKTIACYGEKNGQLQATATGGTSGKTYKWFQKAGNNFTAIDGATTATLSNIGVGTYRVEVKDNSNKTASKDIEFSQPALLTAQSAIVKPTAYNSSDGKITITPTGGTSPYSYKWQHNNSTANPLTNIPASNTPYKVTITDAKGCTAKLDVELIYNLGVDITVTTPIPCNDGTGTLSAVATGGVSTSYTYKWFEINAANSEVTLSSTTAVLSGVKTGKYKVKVTDAKNTVAEKTVQLAQPAKLTAKSEVTLPSAYNASNGKITITPTGGTTPYSYKWDYNNSTANPLTNIPAKDAPYKVTVTDANKCTATLDDIYVIYYPMAANIVVQKAISCYGKNDGSLQVSVTGGTSGKTYKWYSKGSNNNFTVINGATAATLNNLSAGTYRVEATDSRNVTISKEIELQQPKLLTADASIKEPSTPDASDGEIKITASGGTPSYSYKWNYNNSTANPLTKIPARDEPYKVTVTDSKGCTTTLDNISVIYYPMEVNIVAEKEIACFGGVGNLKAVVKGGTSTKIYQWYSKNTDNSFGYINGATNTILQNVGKGTYRVRVKDGNDTTKYRDFELKQPAQLTAEYKVSMPSAYNASDGKITITPTGGTTPYSYSWNYNNSTANPLTNIPAKDEPYKVTVKDAKGCSVALSPRIIYPLDVNLKISASIPCYGGVATLQAIATGGVGTDYSYQWYKIDESYYNNENEIAKGKSASLGSITAGKYRVQATDKENNQKKSSIIDVTQPAQLTAKYEITLPSAHNVADGKIKITVSGGTTPYSYTLDDKSVANPITGVTARDNPYKVIVKDAKGCSVELKPRVIYPLSVKITIANAIPCYGGTGTLKAEAVGGVGTNYSYKWYKVTNGIPQLLTTNGNTLTNVLTGIYCVEAIDLENNIIKSTNLTIPQPAQLTAEYEITLPSAHNASDGKIKITVSGGTTPYSYTLDDKSATNPITGISAKDNPYKVIVKDAKGCNVELKPRVIYPLSVKLTIADAISCYGGTGNLKATAVGGVGTNYSYKWYKVNNGVSQSLTANGNTLTNVLTGTYCVEVSDPENNIAKSTNLTIPQPAQLSAGCEITLPSAHNAADGKLKVTVSGGTTPYSYTLDDKSVANPITGVTARDNPYKVIVKDAKGCSVELKPRVIYPLSVKITIANAIPCYGGTGTLKAEAVGGVGTNYSYKWYKVTNGISQLLTANGNTLTNVLTGIYCVEAIDLENNIVKSTNLTIPQPAQLTAEYEITLPSAHNASDGKIKITVSGGTTPYSYTLDDKSATNPITGISAKDNPYKVIVKDAKGCSVELKPRVIYPLSVKLTIADAISCYGGTGNLKATAVGGIGTSYSYKWYEIVNGKSQSLTANSNTLTNVLTGTYRVEVTDVENNIVKSTNLTIPQPVRLTADYDIILPSAYNVADGKIQITVSGGTTPYSYTLDGKSTTNPVTNIPAKDNPYKIIVKDAKGCNVELKPRVIYPLSVKVTIVDSISCYGGTGTLKAIAVGGVGTNYSYKWYKVNNGAPQLLTENSNTLTNVLTGIYCVEVIDLENNIVKSTNLTVPQPVRLTADYDITLPSAHNAADGKIKVTVSGGTTPYSYTLDDKSAKNPITGIPARDNSYKVIVKDAKGCSVELKPRVIYPLSVKITIANSIPCYGGTGTLKAEAVGGVGTNYSYKWYKVTNGTPQLLTANGSTLTNILTGTYCVEIIDFENNIVKSTNLTIPQPTQLTAEYAITLPSAHNASDGKIKITVSGGTTPYSYTLDDKSTTNPITGISARDNSYKVIVKDAKGCSVELKPRVIYPLSVKFTIVDSIPCYGGTGTLKAITVGGVGTNYSYKWYEVINGKSQSLTEKSNTLTNVLTGTYRVEVTDLENDIVKSTNLTIPQPVRLTADYDITLPSAHNASDGKIKITVSGGTTPYSYTLDGKSTKNPVTNIPAKDNPYNIIVKDAKGCNVELKPRVIYPLSVKMTIVDSIPCYGGTGTLKAVAVGGVGTNYSYKWYKVNNGVPQPLTENGNTLTNVLTGIYHVEAIDLENNIVKSTNLTIPQPTRLIADYDIILPSAHNAADGKIEVTVSGGTTPYSYTLDGKSTKNPITGIPARDNLYKVIVKDAKGCSVELKPRVIYPLSVKMTIVDSIPCYGGTGTLKAITVGGVGTNYSYKWYKVTNGIPQTLTANVNTLTNVLTGIYHVEAIDLENNIVKSTNLTIPQPTQLTADYDIILPSAHNASDGKIKITVSGGTTPYSYTLDDKSTINPITGIPARDNPYKVIVKDVKGCSEELNPRVIYPLSVKMTIVDSIPCYGGTGTLKAIATGGVGTNYSYKWYKVTNGISQLLTENGNTLTNVLTGTYRVEIIDLEDNIVKSINLTIPQPVRLTADYDIVLPSAHDAADGEIELTVSGGTTPYSYTLDDKSATNPITGIPARDDPYEVIVKDAKGCNVELKPRVIYPLSVEITIVDSISCYGGTGTLKAIAVGGVGTNYSYKWYKVDNGISQSLAENNNILTNVLIGTYRVEVIDLANNIVKSTNLTIPQPVRLTADYGIVLPSAHDAADGEIEITVSGGTTPYSYTLDDKSATNPITGIPARDNPYKVIVKDVKECSVELKPRVIYPLSVEITIVDSISCYGGTGTLKAIAVGGVGTNYSYRWHQVNDGISQSLAENSNILTNVLTGTYRVEVVDIENNIVQSTDQTILQPVQLTADYEIILPSAYNASDGKVRVTTSGGTVPYSYAWENYNAITDSLTDIPAKDAPYKITVTDAKGCKVELYPRIIYPLAVELKIIDSIPCYDGTGILQAIATGGTGTDYSYQWYKLNEDFSSEEAIFSGKSAILNNVISGKYRVAVTDIEDNTEQSGIIEVTQPDYLSVEYIVNLPSAYNASDGRITITTSGGIFPYSYSWEHNETITNPFVDDIPARDNPYKITVTDLKGCSKTIDDIYVIYYPMDVDIVEDKHVSCHGGNDGQLRAVTTGGVTTNRIYSWYKIGSNDEMFISQGNSDTLTNVGTGIYRVKVTDIRDSAVISADFELIQPDLLITGAEITVPTAYNTSDGTIEVIASGGTVPYFYKWNYNNSSVNLLENIPANDNPYTVTVSDSRGCMETLYPRIIYYPIEVTIVQDKPVSCYGESDGKLRAIAIGGVNANRIYKWSKIVNGYEIILEEGIDIDTLMNIDKGRYRVEVTDVQDSTAISEYIDVVQPDLLTAIDSITLPSAYNSSDGKIEITPSGGTVPYSYKWDYNNSATNLLENIPANDSPYIVTVTDLRGCAKTLAPRVIYPLKVEIAIIDSISCYLGSNGTLKATATGGVGTNYSYKWHKVELGNDKLLDAERDILSGVNVGRYYAEAIDIEGNKASSAYLEINHPTQLKIDYEVILTSSADATDGKIEATVSGGAPAYSYFWDYDNNTTNILTGLPSGETFYKLIVTDRNGCRDSIRTRLVYPMKVNISVEDSISCYENIDGRLKANAVGGLNKNYEYQWYKLDKGEENIISGATGEELPNAGAGIYRVRVTGLEDNTAFADITFNSPDLLIITPVITMPSAYNTFDGAITLTVGGGTPGYFYAWNYNNATGDRLTDIPASDTPYTVIVSDARNCSVTASPRIIYSLEAKIAVVDSITCYGREDGRLKATATGGVGTNYSYQWYRIENGMDKLLDDENNVEFTGADEGTYRVKVTDIENTSILSDEFVLIQPDSLAVNHYITMPSAYNASDGAIRLSVKGGTPGYSYAWNYNNATDDRLTNISANDTPYTVTVNDTRNCFVTILPKIIYPLNVEIVVDDSISCYKHSDGQLKAVATGGVGTNYSYQWYKIENGTDKLLDGENNVTLAGVGEGEYRVKATDIENTSVLSNKFMIIQPDLLTVNDNITMPSAYNALDGSIKLTVKGGTPGYFYTWNYNNVTGDRLTNIPANDTPYTVTVSDIRNCSVTISPRIIYPLEVEIVVDDSISCYEHSDGQLKAIANGGVGTNYSYQWYKIENGMDKLLDNENNVILAGVGEGEYRVKATDIENTSVLSDIFVLKQPDLLTVNYKLSMPSAYNASDGSIKLTVKGGTPGYFYTWNYNNATGDRLADIPASDTPYTVTVSDTRNCSVTISPRIIYPMGVGIVIDDSISCYKYSDGRLKAIVTGGVGTNYSYQWYKIEDGTDKLLDGENNIALAGIGEGEYRVKAIDIENTSVLSDIFVLKQPDLLTVNYDLTTPSAYNASDGSIKLTVKGGTPGYSYAWNYNSATGDRLTGISANDTPYIVTVNDTRNCSVTISPRIIYPMEVKIVIDDSISCYEHSDGQLKAVVTGGVGTNYSYQWYKIENGTDKLLDGENNVALAGVSEGKYQVKATDIENTSVLSNRFVIIQPDLLTVNYDLTMPSAYNASDGAIKLTVKGGTPEYSYAWNYNRATGDRLTGISANDTPYTVTVNDTRNCSVTISPRIIYPMEVEIVIVDSISCYKHSDGQLKAIATGGVGTNYSYQWYKVENGTDKLLDGENNVTLTGIGEGTYRVKVTDIENTSVLSNKFVLVQPDLLTVNDNITMPSAYNVSDGSIKLTVKGGTPGYSYAWNYNNATGDRLADIPASDTPYIITVSDARNCSVTISQRIIYPLEVKIVADSSISCYEHSDGQLKAIATGGVGTNYSYKWYKIENGIDKLLDSENKVTLTGVGAGKYRVKATDTENTSILSDVFALKQPDLLTVNSDLTMPSAYDAFDGSIQLTVKGGTPGYSYAWNYNKATGDRLTDIPANDTPYTVTVSDTRNCSVTTSQRIIYPLEVEIVVADSISCYEHSDGQLKAIVTGGVGKNYSYQWYKIENGEDKLLDGANNVILSSVGAGKYRVKVTDVENTSVLSNKFMIVQPDLLTVDYNLTMPSAYNAADGSIELAVEGGTPGYFYSWNYNNVTGNRLTGISANDTPYTVTVRDTRNCSVTISPRIINSMKVEIVISDSISCYEHSDGQLKAVVIGGVGTNYSYQWYKIENGADKLLDGENNVTLAGVGAGKYRVKATDIENTSVLSNKFMLVQPDLLTVNDNITMPSAYNASDGSIKLTVKGGTPGYSYAWNYNNATGDGLTDISASDTPYTVTVSDTRNCSVTISQRIIYPLEVKIVADSSISCYAHSDGQLRTIATGGFGTNYSYQWYKIENGTDKLLDDENKVTLTGVGAGKYRVKATDTENTSILSDVFVLKQPDLLTVNSDLTMPSAYDAFDGSIQLTIKGGTPGYSYAWNYNKATGDRLTDIPANDTPYTVTVSDTKKCSVTISQRIIYPLEVEIVVADSISCHEHSDGQLKAIVTGGVGTSYSYQWYKIEDGADKLLDGANNVTLSGVGGGKYRVKVTDIEKTSVLSNKLMIIQPDLLTVDYDLTMPSAYNASDGSIKLSVEGGTPGYSYAWNYNNATGDRLAGISANDTPYTVTVRDTRNCSVTISPRIINSMKVEVVVADSISCYEHSDGQLKAIVTGGVGTNYSYQWYKIENGADKLLDGENNITLAGVGAGKYRVKATDIENTSVLSNKFMLVQPDLLTVNDNITMPSAYNVSDGSIQLTIKGGTPGYSYAWNYNNATSDRLTGIPANDTPYIVTVNDTRNCSVTISQRIIYPLEVKIVAANSISCYEHSNGQLQAVATGGVSTDYSYQWYKIENGTDKLLDDENKVTLTSVGAGKYRVKATDIENTSVLSDVFVLKRPDLLTVDCNLTMPSAYNASDGSIKLTVTGGTPGYSYAWNYNNATGDKLTDIPANDMPYTVTVNDTRNCSVTVSPRIIYPLEVKIVVTDSISCYGRNDGQLKAIATGGVGTNYSYQWYKVENGTKKLLDGENTLTLAGVEKGEYHVKVTDNEDNTSTTSLIFNQPELLIVDVEYLHSELRCKSDTDGSVRLLVNGGTLPYFYLWSDETTAAINSSLSDGSHTFKVTDSRGCYYSEAVEIASPDELTANIEHVEPNAFNFADASVHVEVKGGTTPYKYAWNGRSETTASLNDITHGIYTAVVTDANGCTKKITDTVHNPPLLEVFISKISSISCHGRNDGSLSANSQGGVGKHEYVWYCISGNSVKQVCTSKDADNLPAGIYRVQVIDGNGITVDSPDVELVEPTALKVFTSSSGISCQEIENTWVEASADGGTKPYSYLWTSGHKTAYVDGLPNDKYMVFVTDARGCEIKATAEIRTAPRMTIETSVTQPACAADGAITLNVKDGIAPYTFLWNDGSIDKNRNNLPAGNYRVTITGANECSIHTDIQLDKPESVSLDLGNDRIVLCKGQQVEYNVTDIDDMANYKWFRNGKLFTETPVVSISEEGFYTVEVVNSKGCRNEGSVDISVKSNSIEADFTAATKAIRYEITKLVNISYPYPDKVEWIIPEDNPDISIIDKTDEYVEIIFKENGSYTIGLQSSTDGCHAIISKQIDVYDRYDVLEYEPEQNVFLKSFIAYPNPSKGQFTVKIELGTKADIRLRLVSITGSIIDDRELKGNDYYEILYNINNVQGIYLLQLTSEKAETSLKLVMDSF